MRCRPNGMQPYWPTVQRRLPDPRLARQPTLLLAALQTPANKAILAN